METQRTTAALGVARRAAVPPFHVMHVWSAAAERQRTHGDLVNLSAGQPSTPAPAAVRAAAAAAVKDDLLGYAVALGIPELRAAIAGHYERTYGLAVTTDEVVVTTGSSGAFLATFLAAFDVGDRVAMTRPNFPCYRNVLAALGCEVVELPAGPETRYQPTVAMLESLPAPVKGLIIASPANPTGTILDPGELADLAAYCESAGVQLISDEVYHGISFAGSPAIASAWSASREAVVVNSFSKYFSMTGWRLGWMLVPSRLQPAIDCLVGNFTVCAPVLSQRAALGAFARASYAEVDGHVARYATNRDLLVAGLPDLGVTRLAPSDGAFYVWADVSHLTTDWMDLTYRLLAETGVAVAPGIDFDPVDGRRWIRISCAGTVDDVTEALRRLRAWVR